MTPDQASPAVAHETLKFERTYNAAPARVFAAFADVKIRARWSAPSATAAIVYSESNFKVGGTDIARCGAKGDLRFTVIARYEQILENRRIVFVETVADGALLLSIAIVTWELAPVAAGTKLLVTDQLTSLVGDDMVSGTRFGMNAALNNLAREFG